MADSYLLKPGAATLEAWRAAAKKLGYSSLAQFLIAAANEKASSAERQPALLEVAVPDVVAEARARAGKAPRREPCVHRISPAAFCKVCDS